VTFLLDGSPRTVSITRAHLEEDAGKSSHSGNFSLINYNRSGVPLLEIVSGPDMSSPAEAAAYARTLRQILRYLDVCDGNLEEGSLRCDCNISLRKRGAEKLGTKVEIKNINSFRFVEKALEYEIDRQFELLDRGEKIVQETRLWDPDKNRTFSMRLKEDAEDYRYFPDPDLLPLEVSDSWLSQVKSTLPELPLDRLNRFQKQYGLPFNDADILTTERELADFFEQTAKLSGNPKGAANWIMTELMRQLNEAQKPIANSPVSPDNLAKLIQLIDAGTISGKIAKTVFLEMWNNPKDPEIIIKEKGLIQISDESAIDKIIDEVLALNGPSVIDYRSGKTKLFGFFVGQIMKASQGQANPEKVNELLKKKLEV
jgi:aspartyl-tRNA(Asn)/glutamyl-tRNA(Gln) amidotransferase subunit B